MDSSSWPSYSSIDGELEAIIAHVPRPKSFADYAHAQDLRQSFAEQIAQGVAAGLIALPDWTGYHKAEIQIPTRDGGSLRSIVYRDADAKRANGPLFVYFHGGGWTFGQPEFGEPYAEMLVEKLGITFVSVGYRLSPEHVFPTAAHDAIDAVNWVAQHASEFGGDPCKGFIVGGTSAGANLAAVAAHEAVDSGLSPPLTGVVLMSPAVCHHEAVPAEYEKHITSWEEHKDALVLDRKGMQWFYENYKPDPQSPLASPLMWKRHKGQPATYMQVMGTDPLRDSALVYEHVLKQARTATKVDVYTGIPHGGPDFFPMHSVAKKAVEDLKEGVGWIMKLAS